MEYLQYIKELNLDSLDRMSFKPYYKWNTFNTLDTRDLERENTRVLNLIINGIPSIHFYELYIV